MILVLDNYDSFTYNLVHLVGAFTEDLQVYRNDKITLDEIRALQPEKILLSPGPGRPENAGILTSVIETFYQEIPMLGVCLGHQAIGQVFGGRVTYAPSLMHGKTSLIHHNNEGIFNHLPQPFEATRYHSLVVEPTSLPECLEVTATTKDGVIMGIRHKTAPLEGVQFHPESILTLQSGGGKIIENWVKANISTVA